MVKFESIMFGSYLVTIVDQMCLIFCCELTMTESTWKILKLDWITPRIFFIQKSGNPVHYGLQTTFSTVGELRCAFFVKC